VPPPQIGARRAGGDFTPQRVFGAAWTSASGSPSAYDAYHRMSGKSSSRANLIPQAAGGLASHPASQASDPPQDNSDDHASRSKRPLIGNRVHSPACHAPSAAIRPVSTGVAHATPPIPQCPRDHAHSHVHQRTRSAIQGSTPFLLDVHASPPRTSAEQYPSRITGTMGSPCQYSGSGGSGTPPGSAPARAE
jgi:hypothetical protein